VNNGRSLFELKINGIDCYGLNQGDQRRIEQIGYWNWIDEVATKQLAAGTSAQPASRASITRNRCTCSICQKDFYARRRDAQFCSQRCRQKANYRGVKITIRIPTRRKRASELEP